MPSPTAYGATHRRISQARAASRFAGPLPPLVTIMLALGGALAISHLLVVLGLH